MIILDVEPVPKPTLTQRDKWLKRKRVVKYYDFRNFIRTQKIDIDFNKQVNITFYISMPKSWSKKKRLEMNGKPHQVKPDYDNLCKALGDALFDSDAHIWNAHVVKKWSEKGRITLENSKE